MDSVTNWKKILLQWVVKCNLLEKTFYSLDQTEVETFFTGFKDLFKEGNICQYKNLSDFFKEEYPLFEPHYDDENTLSSSDHIYVYSLLLHFSCVKVSNAFFQENCKKLDDFAQRNITTFFEKLLNEESLTKQTLRRVIASIHGFTPPSTRLMYTADSPVKTPKKTDISPPTPRSCMLIEKNKKVNFLNAQLDTLSYEKSVLETDLKSSQDKIDKLLREHKKLSQENQDLKNEISSRSKESIDCGTRQHSGEEQIRKLIKKNAQYEEEIAKLREQIDELSLSEEKNILCEKLKKAEIQMKYLQDNVSCLAQQVDDFTQELEDTPALDDSSSTLLNTGQRKKVSGATSYKRPGPPTPSKNAGRLSFGGIGELNRELLKESHDSASCSSSSTKTPAKFKFFSSKLSMRGDERKSVLANFKRKLQSGGSGGTIQCSSTPRKSKAHIDQRRLLDQIMSTVSPGPNYSPADSIIQPVNLPSSLKNSESNRRMSAKFKWRQRLPSFASDSGNSDVNCAQKIGGRLGSGSGSGSAKRRVVKRAKDRRGSIYFRGTMFARNCRTPTNDTREAYKSKAKIHRIANFNKYRQHVLNERESLCSNWDDDEACNNNNNDDGFFMEKVNQRKHNLQQVGFTNENDENFNNDQSSKHFQQLLESKESHAPFEISGMQSNQSFLNANNSSSNAHSTSRTIYGASVILNRKIPHINTTMVRKSSIYVKGSDGKSVILVTNQTITLKDLAAMWFQMNFSTRSVIAFSLTATLIGVISFAIQFINH